MKHQNVSANGPLGRLVPNPKARLREQVHEVARFKHLSLRTEEAYWGWIIRFLKFHRGKAAPPPGPLSIPQRAVGRGEGEVMGGAHGVTRPTEVNGIKIKSKIKMALLGQQAPHLLRMLDSEQFSYGTGM